MTDIDHGHDLTSLDDADLDRRLQLAAESLASELGHDWPDEPRCLRLRAYRDEVTAEIARRTSPAPEGWQGITDDSLAAWAMGKLAEAHTERDRIRRNAQAYIDQIQGDALRDENPLTDRIGWFEGQIRTYFEQLPGDPSTYKLPNGQIQRRKGRESTKVTEPAAFLTWATEHLPDAVKRSPLTTPLKGWVRTDEGGIVSPDGEPVPGIEIVVGEPTVTIKPAARPS